MTMSKRNMKPILRLSRKGVAAAIGLGTLLLLVVVGLVHGLARLKMGVDDSLKVEGKSSTERRYSPNTHSRDRDSGYHSKQADITFKKERIKGSLGGEAAFLSAVNSARTFSEIADARYALLRYYAQNNPEEGARWLLSLDASENIGGLLRAFGSNLVRLKGGDWETVARMFPPEMRIDFAKGAMIGLGETDAKAAWLKVNEFSKEHGAPDDFASDILRRIVIRNPEGARELMDINAAPENARFFFENAEFRDQNLAAQTLASIVDPTVLEECCANYIRRMSSNDLEGFGDALITQFKPSANRDAWILQVVKRIYPESISKAAPLIRQISDPEIRNSVTKTIYGYADGVGGKFAQRARELIPE